MTDLPAATFCAEGCVRILGFTPETVSRTFLEVTLLLPLFTMQRYRLPLFFAVASTLALALVMPLQFFHVLPLSLLYCH